MKKKKAEKRKTGKDGGWCREKIINEVRKEGRMRIEKTKVMQMVADRERRKERRRKKRFRRTEQRKMRGRVGW